VYCSRLLASYCLSVYVWCCILWRIGSVWTLGVKSCTFMFLAGNFLFTSSDLSAVGWIIRLQNRLMTRLLRCLTPRTPPSSLMAYSYWSIAVLISSCHCWRSAARCQVEWMPMLKGWISFETVLSQVSQGRPLGLLMIVVDSTLAVEQCLYIAVINLPDQYKSWFIVWSYITERLMISVEHVHLDAMCASVCYVSHLTMNRATNPNSNHRLNLSPLAR